MGQSNSDCDILLQILMWVCVWWEWGLERADGEAGEGRTVLLGFFKKENLGEIFLYATYTKNTPLFKVIWTELHIQHALKSKSGH